MSYTAPLIRRPIVTCIIGLHSYNENWITERVNIESKYKTIGRDPSCDLVLENQSISALHASLELADNGLLSLSENNSGNELYLNRNDHWIRVRKMTLCIGDRVRVGELDIPLHQLTALFGDGSNAKLESRRFSNNPGKMTNRPLPGKPNSAHRLKKPMRNPVTGKIEENAD